MGSSENLFIWGWCSAGLPKIEKSSYADSSIFSLCGQRVSDLLPYLLISCMVLKYCTNYTGKTTQFWHSKGGCDFALSGSMPPHLSNAVASFFTHLEGGLFLYQDFLFIYIMHLLWGSLNYAVPEFDCTRLCQSLKYPICSPTMAPGPTSIGRCCTDN